MKPTIKELVTNNHADFARFREGVFFYRVGLRHEDKWKTFEFPVPLEDVTGATLFCRDKAIFFMRWIRKSIADNTLMEIK